MNTLTDDIRKIVRQECDRLGDRIIGGQPRTPTQTAAQADLQDAALRSLDRQRATLRRVIMLSAIFAALVAWGMVGFGFFLAWLLQK